MDIGTQLFLLVVGAGIVFLATLWIRSDAGAAWIWGLRDRDLVRNLFFRQDGSWRHYGKIGFLCLIAALVIFGYIFY